MYLAEYGTMTTFLDAFDNQLYPLIKELADSNRSKLEVSDMMALIDWLDYFVHQADILDDSVGGGRNRHYCIEYQLISAELVNQYLIRITDQVMGWFGNIKKQTIEVVKATDGTLMTSVPEDMFNVIHMQMAVAKEKLPREHLKEVVNACVQVLREVQRQSHDQFESDSEKGILSPDSLCATVNDMQRLQEKADEFSAQFVNAIVQPDDKVLFSAIMEEVSAEYISLAIKAMGYLIKYACCTHTIFYYL